MTRRWLLLFAAPTLAVGAVAMRGSAQQTPPTPGGGGGGGGPTSMPADGPGDGGGSEMNDGGPRGPFGDRGPRGPFGDHGGFGRGGPGGMERRMPSMDVMRGYMELVDRYARLAADPDAAAVSSVLAANDLMRAKGPDAAIAYFVKMLDAAPRPAVKRAIRIQLIDLYKAAGKADLALEQIEVLMKAPNEK